MIDNGSIENKEIPQWTKDYWNLSNTAKLRELVYAIREDEAEHRDVNHEF
jgi:ubiquinol oxidase